MTKSRIRIIGCLRKSTKFPFRGPNSSFLTIVKIGGSRYMFYQGILKIWAFSKIEEFLRRGIERTHCARSPCRRSTAILPLRCYLLIANNDKQFWLTLCTHSTHWECAPLLWPSSISAKGLVVVVIFMLALEGVVNKNDIYNPSDMFIRVQTNTTPALFSSQ